MKTTTYNDTDAPDVSIHEPAPGHLLITGHKPRPVLTEEGYVVPPNECYISPELPTSALIFALAARGMSQPDVAPEPPRKAGRPRREKLPADENKEGAE